MSALQAIACAMLLLALVIAVLSGQIRLLLAVATAAVAADSLCGWDLAHRWRRHL